MQYKTIDKLERNKCYKALIDYPDTNRVLIIKFYCHLDKSFLNCKCLFDNWYIQSKDHKNLEKMLIHFPEDTLFKELNRYKITLEILTAYNY